MTSKHAWQENARIEAVAAFRSGTGVLELTEEATETLLSVYGEGADMAWEDLESWSRIKPFAFRWLRVQGREAARAARHENATRIAPHHVMIGIERGIEREKTLAAQTSFCGLAPQKEQSA